jgi:hypothetical protein
MHWLLIAVLASSVVGIQPVRLRQAPAAEVVYDAADCERATVVAAVAAEPEGGTVTVAPGECTWTEQFTITDRDITLQGAGIDETTIILDMATTPIVITTCSEDDFVTVTGFSFKRQDSGWAEGFIKPVCASNTGYPVVSFRITGNKFYGDPLDGLTGGTARFVYAVHIWGVIDHNIFTSQTSLGAGNVAAACNGQNVGAAAIYHEPFELGDENAVYIEDNVFDFGATPVAISNGFHDGYCGARSVVRFNTVYNNNAGNHGLDSQVRGVPTFELYGNTFIAESGSGDKILFFARSGTGVIWGNDIDNEPGASDGYTRLFAVQYYGATGPYDRSTNMWLNNRPTVWYPSGAWGPPYGGMTSIFDNSGHKVSGANPIDGNFHGAGDFDPDSTRTCTDLETTAGSTTITSDCADFVLADDRPKFISATNITEGRMLTDCTYSSGDATLTCTSGNFTDGDIGRLIRSCCAGTGVPQGTTIASITSSTEVEMSATATGSSGAGTGKVDLIESYIVSVTNERTAVLNVRATASTAGPSGTLTIGYLREGYPALDQPGYGYFASANAGSWPTQTSYSAANYQQLMPIYLAANVWDGGTPPTSGLDKPSMGAYMKSDREWYDQVGGVQTNATTPFNGTTGTGFGTLANRPTTCTAGVGYWATDQGSWNSSSSNPYGVQQNGADGVLYKCTATDTWTLYYTPYEYPHPRNTP